MMGSRIYGLLATVGLVTMFWLFDIVQRPGTQALAAVAMGVLSSVTVSCIVRAAQARGTEERIKVRIGDESRNGL